MTPQTTKLLQDRLGVIPKEIADFINSNQINEIVLKIQKEFSLSETQATQLSNEVVLTVLFFSPASELSGRIETVLGLDGETAKKIYSSLDSSIFSVYKDLYSLSELTNETTPSPETPAPNKDQPIDPNNISADIEETEAAIKAIPKPPTTAISVPTPTTDKEVTHSSTQADILQKDKPVMPSNAPRWGNEEK